MRINYCYFGSGIADHGDVFVGEMDALIISPRSDEHSIAVRGGIDACLNRELISGNVDLCSERA